MARSHFLNGGAYSRTVPQIAVASEAEDGEWVSRSNGDGGYSQSAKLVIAYTADLAADETLSVSAQFQDAVDEEGAGEEEYGFAVDPFVVAVGDSGGSGISNTAEIDINLSGAREFIRSQVTVEASDSGTFEYSAFIVFYGESSRPITKSPVNVTDD